MNEATIAGGGQAAVAPEAPAKPRGEAKRVKLGKAAVDALKPRSAAYVTWDAEVVGLGLKVQPTGSKAYVLRYRQDGKQRELTLGPHGKLTVDSARKMAKRRARESLSGVDPLAARAEARRQSEAPTLGEAVAAYAERHLPGLRSGRVAHACLKNHLGPLLTRKVDSITRSDMAKRLAAVSEEAGPGAANKLFAYSSPMFKRLLADGEIEANPLANLQKPHAEQARDRALSDHELKLMLLATAKLSSVMSAFVKVLALTLQRRSEVAGMRWADLTGLDGDAPLWTIPATDAKNKRRHVVPLAPAVAAILRERLAEALAPANDRGKAKPLPPYVFSTNGKNAISGFSRMKASLDGHIATLAKNLGEPAPAPWSLHDLRRTGVSQMANSGISEAIADRVLNHIAASTRSSVLRIYQVSNGLEPRRHALNIWAAHVVSLTEAATGEPKVVKLRAG